MIKPVLLCAAAALVSLSVLPRPAWAAGECPATDTLTNQMTPPDFYKLLAGCIDAEKYEEATVFYAYSDAYLQYDAEKMIDPKAASRASSLLSNDLAKIKKEKVKAYGSLLTDRMRSYDWMQKVCSLVIDLGPPGYAVPLYMISKGGDPAAETQPIVTPKLTWLNVVRRRLKCPTDGL